MKKVISILLVISALFLTGCGKKQEVDNENAAPENNVVNEEQTNVKETPAPKKNEEIEQTQNQTGELTTEEFLEMVDRFNALEDGDPEKEELRTKLDAIFRAAGE